MQLSVGPAGDVRVNVVPQANSTAGAPAPVDGKENAKLSAEADRTWLAEAELVIHERKPAARRFLGDPVALSDTEGILMALVPSPLPRNARSRG